SGCACEETGSFRLPRLPPGDVEIEASARGLATTYVRATTERAEPLVVTLTRGGRLVVLAENAGGARVGVVGADGHARTGLVLDASGELALRLPVGGARVEVAGRAPIDAEIRDGATTTVRVRAAK